MPKFTVYEVQEETVLRCWQYEVDAESQEQAIEFAQTGDFESGPEDCDEVGDPDYGNSGWAAREGGEDEAEQAWSEAIENICE